MACPMLASLRQMSPHRLRSYFSEPASDRGSKRAAPAHSHCRLSSHVLPALAKATLKSQVRSHPSNALAWVWSRHLPSSVRGPRSRAETSGGNWKFRYAGTELSPRFDRPVSFVVVPSWGSYTRKPTRVQTRRPRRATASHEAPGAAAGRPCTRSPKDSRVPRGHEGR